MPLRLRLVEGKVQEHGRAAREIRDVGYKYMEVLGYIRQTQTETGILASTQIREPVACVEPVRSEELSEKDQT